MIMRQLLTTLTLLLAVTSASAPVTAVGQKPGGCACVVAKQRGDSVAIEWATGENSVSDAIDKAKQALGDRGYEYAFPQGNSPLPHGWLVVVETEYRTFTGNMRTRYGCGFSDNSEADAVDKALNDLQTYALDWKPRYGYEVIERERY